MKSLLINLCFIVGGIVFCGIGISYSYPSDQCARQRSFCVNSCNRYYNQCISQGPRVNPPEHCVDQHGTCLQGCDDASRNCPIPLKTKGTSEKQKKPVNKGTLEKQKELVNKK